MAVRDMYVSGISVCLTSLLAYLCCSPPLNIIVKQRDYLYLQLNANLFRHLSRITFIH